MEWISFFFGVVVGVASLASACGATIFIATKSKKQKPASGSILLTEYQRCTTAEQVAVLAAVHAGIMSMIRDGRPNRLAQLQSAETKLLRGWGFI